MAKRSNGAFSEKWTRSNWKLWAGSNKNQREIERRPKAEACGIIYEKNEIIFGNYYENGDDTNPKEQIGE
jgi:hypothetical protein